MSDRVLWPVIYAVHVHRQASTFSTCVGTKDRSCVKRSKARQPHATEPGRLSISTSNVRHRKRSSSPRVSFCRGALFLPTVPLSSYPKDLKAHLLVKLLCFQPFASTNYQSDGASSLFFAACVRHRAYTKT